MELVVISLLNFWELTTTSMTLCHGFTDFFDSRTGTTVVENRSLGAKALKNFIGRAQGLE